MGRAAIVLAAGHGTRMKSKRHKVLHPVCGKPMILHILSQLERLRLDQVLVVVGQHREAVEAAVAGRADVVVQEAQLGTGHAVQVALPALADRIDTVVVLYGDAPLIEAETVERLLSEREARGAAACVLTAEVPDPTGLGRVEMGSDGLVTRIVEEKDASAEQRQNRLINTGIYAFARAELEPVLAQVRPDNAQGEYYLTDTVAILRAAGKAVYAVQAGDPDEVASVNDRWQLAEVERILRRRINRRWARDGVTLVDPDHTYIGTDVQIGPDTVIYPGCVLEGTTRIGSDCVIGPNTRLVDSVVGDGAVVEQSVVLNSEIGPRASVGPFAYVRPGSRVGAGVKIGDFVEIKNSVIGDGTKVSHLAYVGDADVGRRVNVGCGVITVNYDGEKKHRTVIGNDAFVGSNVNLIAPVTVGDGAYLCAGSTITDDVPADGFAISRPRQVTKPGYVRAWKEKRQARVQTEGRTGDAEGR